MAFFDDVRTAYRLRRFWMLDAWLDVTMRHRSSLLGLVWNLLPTVFFVALIGSIFQRVMNEGASFYLYLTCGLVIWTPINHILSGSAECYRTNSAFVMAGGLNLITFNLKMIFHALIHLLIQSVLIVIAILIFKPNITSDILYSFLGIILLLSFLFPVSIILALLGTRFGDFSEAFKAFVRILFLSTPIIWTVNNVARLESVGQFLYLNPLFFAIELIRSPLIGAPVNHSYWGPFIAYTVVTWIIAFVLYGRLGKTTTLWL